MFKVKNQKELLNLLKIIAEESSNMSKKSIMENLDPYDNLYKKQKKSDEKLFGSLKEEDEEEVDEEEVDEEEVDEEETEQPQKEDEEEVDEEETEEKVETSSEGDTFGVSFDSVISAINALRAGRSLKDSGVRDQAAAYYDRLDDNERKVLLLFLKELSKILSGAIKGSDASDPSGAPLHIHMSPDDEEEEAEEEIPAPEDEPSKQSAPEDEEDTSPPIKINEAQDTTNIRRKIRRLILN